MDRQQALKTLSAPGMPLEMGNTEVYGKTRRIYKNAPKSLRELFSQTLSNETFLVFEGHLHLHHQSKLYQNLE